MWGDNVYFFATTEYGDVIPETIRRSESDAESALCAFANKNIEVCLKDGCCIAKVNGLGPVFEAHGTIEYVKGFRKRD